MSSEIPAGWYPDPANHTQERWWDGAGWTSHTQVPMAIEAMTAVNAGSQAHGGRRTVLTDGDGGRIGDAAPPRLTARMVGVGLLLLLVTLGSALGTVTFLQMRDSAGEGSADPDSAPVADGEARGETPVLGNDEDASGEDPPTDAQADTDPPEVQQPSVTEEQAAPRPVTVTLDGQCTLTLDEATIARSDRIRPWDYPECAWAPVALPPGGERWIVVLASLNSVDFGPQDARARAQGLGVPDAVLWSTHYPSLNPDLWVVFDGPFPSEAAAGSAARGWGTTAYPRVLSDSAGDRYCLSPDGCVGERAD